MRNESLAYLHGPTGNDSYLAAARKFDNAEVMDPVADGEDVLNGRHANQHIPPGSTRWAGHAAARRSA